MTAKQMIAILAATLIVYVIVAYLSRATPRRALSALIGGVLAGIAGCVLDTIGSWLGYWHYAGNSIEHAPPLVYAAVSFWAAAVALIGWRLARRFGPYSLVVVIALGAVFATIQDYVAAYLKASVQTIAPGITPFVGDIMVWATVVAVALIVQRILGGPFTAERLART